MRVGRMCCRMLPIVFGAVVMQPAATGQGWSDGTPLYPEKLHEDLELLRTVIHEAHPDPYRYHTRSELDRTFDRIRDSIRQPLDARRFMEAIMPLFHMIGDAHCQPLPTEGGQPGSEADVAILPLRLRVLQDGLYVAEELKGFRSIPPGSRILSINERSAEQIMEELGRLIVTDGANRTLRTRRIEREFSTLYHHHLDRSTVFKVRFLDTHGVASEQLVMAMTREEMQRTRKPQGVSLLPWGGAMVEGASAFWLELHTLDKDSLDRAGQRPDKLLNSLLRQLRHEKVHTLVIDVRGAGGRELAMAEMLFAAIAREPFRVIQDMTVRSTVPPHGYEHMVPQHDHYASVSLQFLPGPNGSSSLRADDHRLEMLEPMAAPFSGRVYVICDGLTRDAAAAFVMMARRSGRARVVGEEVGSNSTSITGGRILRLVLPNSGIHIPVPLFRYVPDGQPSGPLDHGEMPHYPVEQLPSGLIKGRDTVREALITMMRDLR